MKILSLKGITGSNLSKCICHPLDHYCSFSWTLLFSWKAYNGWMSIYIACIVYYTRLYNEEGYRLAVNLDLNSDRANTAKMKLKFSFLWYLQHRRSDDTENCHHLSNHNQLNRCAARPGQKKKWKHFTWVTGVILNTWVASTKSLVSFKINLLVK